jgi:lipopolysaccharide transport system permease protein
LDILDEQLKVSVSTGDPLEEWPNEKKQGAVRILLQHWELVQSLTLRDIRSRYKQSVLGIAWALIQPLAMMLIYTVVFSHIARIDTGKIPYPIFSYIVLLPWTFFAGGLTQGTECLVTNFNLITKIYFPREAFPISAILGRVVDLGLGIVVMIPLFFYYHIHITPWLLMIFPVLIIQVCFMLGVTFMMSAFNLFYRDIRHIMPLLVQLWLYLTPIIYPLSLVPKKYMAVYMLNPMTPVMDTYRRVALLHEAPMWGYLGLAAVLSVVMLIVGYRIFKKLEPAFAETI